MNKYRHVTIGSRAKECARLRLEANSTIMILGVSTHAQPSCLDVRKDHADNLAEGRHVEVLNLFMFTERFIAPGDRLLANTCVQENTRAHLLPNHFSLNCRIALVTPLNRGVEPLNGKHLA